ncbi:iron-containing redox enzyme family protein [Nocardioides lentus]|uniref:Iron-containing redox enzyme family protein n=1 Tax=Nocardioides lentus TaxID=338077 RepID=A0ABP5A5J0_9ACTN
MRLPTPRGPLGHALHALLARAPETDTSPTAPDTLRDALRGADEEDRALSLWVLHELHYRGFDAVDDRWEWHPALAGVRHDLERELEERVRTRFAQAWTGDLPAPADLAETLFTMAETHEGPSLARHVERRATPEQVDDLLRQRSLYHLKEADPTSWVVPRLAAAPKAALVQVQYDEYGAGRADAVHQELFRAGMSEVGLDASYGAFVDEAVLSTLEQNNVLSLFGLHRRLRGAAVGHFAAFEATSSLPSRRLAAGLRRLGYADAMAAYYDEHVEADAVHEQLAAREVCGALVAAEPDLVEDVVMGAWACLDLETRSALALLERWEVAA